MTSATRTTATLALRPPEDAVDASGPLVVPCLMVMGVGRNSGGQGRSDTLTDIRNTWSFSLSSASVVLSVDSAY